jgi:L-threonylcarbamoyladenylate synthase
VLLRPGGLAVEAVEKVLGRKVERPSGGRARVAAGRAAAAPGMLTRHYSPRTPLRLHERIAPERIREAGKDEAFLLLRRPGSALARDPRVRWLSESGKLAAMARGLFAQLRALDSEGWGQLHAEFPAGQSGLAPALRDRLERAAARRS